MKYSVLIRILLFPILFPLSLVYSIVVLIIRLGSFKAYKSNFLVVSVGNLQVGGTGKSPFISELANQLLNEGLQPVIISKSYKATLKKPKEVSIQDNVLEVGDEALMLKKNNPKVRIFSGPTKFQTLKFAEKRIDSEASLFLIDDGAQHHKIFKDIEVIIWDGSRTILDLFSFPFGMSRESLFFSKKTDFVFLNRESNGLLSRFLKYFYSSRPKSLSYEIKTIENFKSERLQKNAKLISGVGNFNYLESSVKKYLKLQGLNLKKSIQAKDHDTFKSYNLDPNEFYICTEKDHDKLIAKVSEDNLYVVNSEFNKDSKANISEVVLSVSDRMKNIKYVSKKI